ncbi:helix-turn-helix domain-containing protein [Xenorhabdus bovienii]|uniref:helix-turn-helix domain-containing protein n=1 Tax=Xenorhabdus bovienii TaxID=40576 RepID=UPI00237D09D0|nr:helix-turn-helix domain-containing protein [Xenorhabdus bovienii]MDE1486418.1 helix-turn-helix domain-containing protein [Xenorhabdus bovienii]MDE1497064.1 helix-turn-helix domain-containing protein [Xenorhabdus bovienii]MDE9437970.1 helix-turn-helix domain-containing protein [Xenorhabdus bovienii]MDE9467333.1 helix-turn-helix domain-containing protein [Xenorhabdus bovienii]MDE9477265.1 helix-turn-helix domain-containing protein [Xenorhabdus bovienii]
MVAIEKGELVVPDENIHYHRLPDVKNLRESFGLKQSEFAEAVGVSASLIQSWEQRRRIPSGSSLKLLKILESNPALIDVLNTL